jgi:phosphatidylglycerol:prolipoprotein diacylglycerol transferase
MLPYLGLFGLAIPVPSITILLGIWFGTSLSEKHAEKYKVSAGNIYNLIFTSLAVGIVGARVFYILKNFPAFSEDLGSIFSLNLGLFDPLGGLVFGVLAAFVYGQRKNMSLWNTLDALTPALAVFAVALPLANFASGNAYGTITTLPWGIELWGAVRHPVQVYEAMAAGMILLYLWPGRGKAQTAAGQVFLQFVALSAFSRLFFEAFRQETSLTIFNLNTIQIIVWVIMAASLWSIYRIMPKPSKGKPE